MEQHHDINKIEVMLEVKGQTIDINKMGLTSMSFKRYLNQETNRASNIMTELDMTFYDDTGYKLMTLIQRSGGEIYLKYGFSNNMSEVFKITPTRYNAVQNNRGMMLGIGGFGIEHMEQWGAELFEEGTSIKTLITDMAKRNRWNIGSYITEAKTYTNIIDITDGMKLPYSVYKRPTETDYDFIRRVILDMLNNMTVFDTSTNKLIKGQSFYDATLVKGSGLELHVFRRDKGYMQKQVWYYDYGVTNTSQVIEMTNEINYDWIINGLTLRVPIHIEDSVKTDLELTQEYTEFFDTKADYIMGLFKQTDFTIPETTELSYKIEFYEADEEEYLTKEEILVKQIKNILNTFNTMQLTVLGNPQIQATDWIMLDARNKEGKPLIQHGLWRVIAITEKIGMGGYHTILDLVKDTETIIPQDKTEVGIDIEITNKDLKQEIEILW